MNNLKRLAAHESGSSALVERLARSKRFIVRSFAGWTSPRMGRTGEVIWTTVCHSGLEMVKFTLKLGARS